LRKQAIQRMKLIPKSVETFRSRIEENAENIENQVITMEKCTSLFNST
jgi:hypothetical protein